MRHLIAFLALAAVAVAQPPADPAPADTSAVPADSSVTRPPPVSIAHLGESLDQARDLARSRREAAERIARAAEEARRQASQPVYAELGTSGALAVLPPGWDGPSTANELRAPSYSSYELTNTRPGHPLLGTTLHLERVTGLQEPFRRLWLNGQTPQGYHGLEGVAAAEVPLPGVAIELAGRGRGGVLALVQTRTAYWAVHVSAPEAVWASRRAELVALLQALQLP